MKEKDGERKSFTKKISMCKAAKLFLQKNSNDHL
jgi:hypothetical protein